MEAPRRGASLPHTAKASGRRRYMRLVASLRIVALVGQPRGGGDVGKLSFTSPGEVAMDGSSWLGEHL